MEYDYVNHPQHYKKFSMETIDMMVAIWGAEAVAKHCEMCAFKYKMRAGEKPGQSVEQDLEKANWYLAKAKDLLARKVRVFNAIGTDIELHPKPITNENQD